MGFSSLHFFAFWSLESTFPSPGLYVDTFTKKGFFVPILLFLEIMYVNHEFKDLSLVFIHGRASTSRIWARSSVDGDNEDLSLYIGRFDS